MSLRDAIIASELGPNPAPITELIWALRVQRGLRVRRLYLLTNDRGEQYLHELHEALGLLRQVFGEAPSLAPLRFAVDGAGQRVEGDISPSESAAWMRARWDNLRRAIDDAGEAPVVFAIASNRERSVLTTGMYTLLARPGDLCLDVRVSEPRVKGARAHFYFPDQPSWCADEQGPIDPRSVEVFLVELQLPQLRGLLSEDALASYDAALAATRVAVAGAGRPRLTVDLAAPSVTLSGMPVPFTDSEALWYAALAMARKGSPEGWIPGYDGVWLAHALQRSREARGQLMWQPPSGVFEELKARKVLGDSPAFRKLRSRTRGRLARFCSEQGILWRELVIPVTRKQQWQGDITTLQRIALEPDRITLLP